MILQNLMHPLYGMMDTSNRQITSFRFIDSDLGNISQLAFTMSIKDEGNIKLPIVAVTNDCLIKGFSEMITNEDTLVYSLGVVRSNLFNPLEDLVVPNPGKFFQSTRQLMSYGHLRKAKIKDQSYYMGHGMCLDVDLNLLFVLGIEIRREPINLEGDPPFRIVSKVLTVNPIVYDINTPLNKYIVQKLIPSFLDEDSGRLINLGVKFYSLFAPNQIVRAKVDFNTDLSSFISRSNIKEADPYEVLEDNIRDIQNLFI